MLRKDQKLAIFPDVIKYWRLQRKLQLAAKETNKKQTKKTLEMWTKNKIKFNNVKSYILFLINEPPKTKKFFDSDCTGLKCYNYFGLTWHMFWNNFLACRTQ
jgi:hypothetical protein